MCKLQEGRAAGCFPLLFNWILVASPLIYYGATDTLSARAFVQVAICTSLKYRDMHHPVCVQRFPKTQSTYFLILEDFTGIYLTSVYFCQSACYCSVLSNVQFVVLEVLDINKKTNHDNGSLVSVNVLQVARSRSSLLFYYCGHPKLRQERNRTQCNQLK